MAWLTWLLMGGPLCGHTNHQEAPQMSAPTLPSDVLAEFPGAVFVGEWEDDSYRLILGRERFVNSELSVVASCIENRDGSTEELHVGFTNDLSNLSASDAQILAAILPVAAEELGRWVR